MGFAVSSLLSVASEPSGVSVANTAPFACWADGGGGGGGRTTKGFLANPPLALGDPRFWLDNKSGAFFDGEHGGGEEEEGGFLFGGEGVIRRSGANARGGAGGGGGRKMATFGLPGLEPIGGEDEGEDATFEDGYVGVLSVEIVDPRLPAKKSNFELDPCLKSVQRFSAGEPLGE